MDKFKKSFVIGIGVIVFLVAVIAALNMTNGAPRPIAKPALNGMGAASQDSLALPSDVSAKNLASPMSGTGFSERSIPENTAGSLAPEMVPLNPQTDKKEIKNGSLSLRVTNTDSATESISKIAKDNGGEVFSSIFYQTDNNIRNGNVEVRVPVQNFEKTISEIKDVAAVVTQESTYGQDVTMEYSDLQTQLKNKQAEEQAFLKILDQSGKISDVLDVTREVARVRGEIESLQGRIKFMDSQTDMASINISLTEDTTVTVSDKWRPLQVVKETLNSLLRDMQGFINFLIVLIIRVIPIFILYGLIIFIAYFAVKKAFFKNKE